MKKAFTRIFFLALLSCSTLPLAAQLSVATLNGSQQLGTLLAGVGITISNAVITCDTNAHGTFNGVLSNVGISGGLVLSTGSIFDLHGPNASGSTSTMLNAPGDPDMDTLTAQMTYDACILDFDFVPVGDTLLFNYVFGSEEYPEFVISTFNDGFAMWLSGPGYAVPTNVAKLPGTSTDVTVNNVNATTNTSFYVDNGDGFAAPQNADTTVIQFDGFTTNMTSISTVVPGSTYHLKIGVADAGDGIFDTGVFLQGGSFRTAGAAVDALKPQAASLQLFPNPAADVFQAVARHLHGQSAWLVVDAQGRVVRAGDWQGAARSGQAQVLTIPVADLQPGLYHFIANGETGTLSRSLLLK
jgi:hypothetical protein